GRGRVGRVRVAPEGQGAAAGRVRAAARGPRALHVPPPRGQRRPDARARRQRGRVRRLRDGRDRQSRTAPARAHERDRRPAFGAGGRLLGGVPGVAPGRVLVIGGGIVGYNAAVIALGLGASVTILERSVDRMRHLDEILTGRVSLVMSSTLQVEESIVEADVVIGAVLIPGAVAPKLVTREMLGVMKNGAVLCDVAIDQGGCAETSHPTTHSDPVYVVDGVTHYCVANMPGAVPITSTKALTNVTLPYVEAIADHGLAEAVARDPALARGVNVLDGKITYEAVAEAHGLEFHPLEDVLPLSPV